MKILNVYKGDLFGGIEKFLITLAAIEKPELVKFEFALCYEGKLAQELKAIGATVHFLGHVRIRDPLGVMHARRALASLIQSGKFDFVVCHASWTQALFASVADKTKTPELFWIHDANRGALWLDKWANSTKPNALIFNSQFTLGVSSHLFSKVRRHVIYYPVPAQNTASAADREAVRRELGEELDIPVIIQLCRLERWKGHELLLRSLGRIKDTERFSCWIVGGPQRPGEQKYFDEIKALAAELGLTNRVRFVGQRSDVARLLAAADIHCQPNQGPEPFGIAFIEALQSGLPLVTTAMGAAPEIVDDTCGVLVPPNDPEKLAFALVSLLRDPDLRHRLGGNGPARAHQLCDPTSHLVHLNSFLSSLGPES